MGKGVRNRVWIANRNPASGPVLQFCTHQRHKSPEHRRRRGANVSMTRWNLEGMELQPPDPTSRNLVPVALSNRLDRSEPGNRNGQKIFAPMLPSYP